MFNVWYSKNEKIKMKLILLSLAFLSIVLWGRAQPTAGTIGLLNIPTAEIHKDGTFVIGTNYLPEAFTPSSFSYPTGNYYFNLTFLPFLDVTYRLTLLKLESGKYNQDRSFGLRIRLSKEQEYLPAFVIGGNDIYTSSPGKRSNQYFGSMYGVVSKTLYWKGYKIGFTTGLGLKAFRNNELKGLFYGISISPDYFKQVSLHAEYDTHHINFGGSAILFGHLYFNVFLNNYRNLMGGLAYKINLNR